MGLLVFQGSVEKLLPCRVKSNIGLKTIFQVPCWCWCSKQWIYDVFLKIKYYLILFTENIILYRYTKLFNFIQNNKKLVFSVDCWIQTPLYIGIYIGYMLFDDSCGCQGGGVNEILEYTYLDWTYYRIY